MDFARLSDGDDGVIDGVFGCGHNVGLSEITEMLGR